jgi:hypothetical protein
MTLPLSHRSSWFIRCEWSARHHDQYPRSKNGRCPIIQTASVPGLDERLYDLLYELNGELGGKSVGKSLVEDKLGHPLLDCRY